MSKILKTPADRFCLEVFPDIDVVVLTHEGKQVRLEGEKAVVELMRTVKSYVAEKGEEAV